MDRTGVKIFYIFFPFQRYIICQNRWSQSLKTPISGRPRLVYEKKGKSTAARYYVLWGPETLPSVGLGPRRVPPARKRAGQANWRYDVQTNLFLYTYMNIFVI